VRFGQAVRQQLHPSRQLLHERGLHGQRGDVLGRGRELHVSVGREVLRGEQLVHCEHDLLYEHGLSGGRDVLGRHVHVWRLGVRWLLQRDLVRAVRLADQLAVRRRGEHVHGVRWGECLQQEHRGVRVQLDVVPAGLLCRRLEWSVRAVVGSVHELLRHGRGNVRRMRVGPDVQRKRRLRVPVGLVVLLREWLLHHERHVLHERGLHSHRRNVHRPRWKLQLPERSEGVLGQQPVHQQRHLLHER